MKMEDGLPIVGSTRTSLGVRVGVDISPDFEDNVHPRAGSMSVMSSVYPPIPSLIPKRLRETDPRYAGGTAPEDSFIFSYGNGDFVDGSLSENLAVRIDKSWHALVEPSSSMALKDYTDALEATRDEWAVAEEKR